MEKERILKEAHPLIVASINKYAIGKDDFEDLYQDGVVKVLELLESYEEGKGVNVFYYLKLHLRFFYLNYGRYDKKETSLNMMISEGVELGSLFVDESPGPEEMLIRTIEGESLVSALRGLKGEDRYIVVELFMKNRTLDGLAKELKVSRTTLFRRKEDILRRLRTEI